MNAKTQTASADAWYANTASRPTDRTSETDDERIKNITVPAMMFWMLRRVLLMSDSTALP